MAQIGIISDIHENYGYLERALDVLQGLEIHCLGDIVERGDNIQEGIDLLAKHGVKAIKGNHEEDVLADTEGLAQGIVNYLESLPKSRDFLEDSVLIHDNPLLLFSGEYKRYIYTPEQAKAVLSLSPYRLNFVGHTHRPMIVSETGDVFVPEDGKIFLKKDSKYLLNPGALMKPRPSFGIYDSDENSFQVLFLEDNN